MRSVTLRGKMKKLCSVSNSNTVSNSNNVFLRIAIRSEIEWPFQRKKRKVASYIQKKNILKTFLCFLIFKKFEKHITFVRVFSTYSNARDTYRTPPQPPI